LRFLISGSGGLVGRALVQVCQESADDFVAYDHSQLDISDTHQVEDAISTIRPDVVINCAAWTNVDGCENDSKYAFAANAEGPENLARSSRKVNARLITISTDYVFDGFKEGFYTQRDGPNPLSVYGKSKLAGEQRAQQANERTVVVRTGFVFGPDGPNFLSSVIKNAVRGLKIKAISDAYGTPTYARHLAQRLRELADVDEPGIFHVVNTGEGASYLDFTNEALMLSGLEHYEVESITNASLNRPAPRPANSRLKCLKTEEVGLAPMPSWRTGLEEFVSGELKFQTRGGTP